MKKNVRVMSLLAPLALATATSVGATLCTDLNTAKNVMAMMGSSVDVECDDHGPLSILDFKGQTKGQVLKSAGAFSKAVEPYVAFIDDGVAVNQVAFIDAEDNKCKPNDAACELNISEDINVDFAYINRTFTNNVYSTLTLPFDLNTGDVEGLNTVLKFNGVKTRKVDGLDKSYVSMKPVWKKGQKAKTLTAYKPYLVLTDDASLTVKTAGVKIKKLPDAETMGLTNTKENDNEKTRFENSLKDEKLMWDKAPMWDVVGDWVLFGTLKGYKWVEDDNNYSKIKDISYGFAGEAADGISAGQFVKAGAGAWIAPFRAFLAKTSIGVDAGSGAGVQNVKSTVGKTPSTFKLPEEMDVVIEDEDEQQTTTIGRLNTRTGEFLKAETRVFDLKGRNINGSAPRARGAYYGKKSVVR